MTLIALLPVMGLIVLVNYLAKQANERHIRLCEWLFLLVQIPFLASGAGLLATPPAVWAQLVEMSAADNPAIGMIRNHQAVGGLLAGMALLGMAVCLPRVRRWLLPLLPGLNVASPVHTLALLLSIYLVGNTLIPLSQGGLESLAENVSLETPLIEVLSQQTAFVLLAFLGVGLLVRRESGLLDGRLGLVRPTWEQVRYGLLWIPVLVIVQSVVGATWAWLQPEQAAVLESVSSELLGDIDTVFEWFALALSAGLGEELLFRGALQPVFGLWATSFLFAIAHMQYGVTPVTLLVLAIGVVLGVIRQRTNTSVAIMVHAGYNFTLGMMSMLALYLEPFLPETAVIWLW